MSDVTISEEAGKSQDTAVIVSRSVSHPVKSVWCALLTVDAAETLLGPGARLGDKGHTWTSDDGRSGVIRSYHPEEQLRFSWRSRDDRPPSYVDLRLIPEGENQTRIQIVHTDLRPEVDRELLRQHWEQALETIDRESL